MLTNLISNLKAHNTVSYIMHKTETLLSSSCVCPVSVEVQHVGLQPQADPQLVSGPLCVTLAQQQTKYPSRDVMSDPVKLRRPKRDKKSDMNPVFLLVFQKIKDHKPFEFHKVTLSPFSSWVWLFYHHPVQQTLKAVSTERAVLETQLTNTLKLKFIYNKQTHKPIWT